MVFLYLLSSSSLLLATPSSSRDLQFLLREVMTDTTRLPNLAENQLLQTPKYGTRRKGLELRGRVRYKRAYSDSKKLLKLCPK